RRCISIRSCSMRMRSSSWRKRRVPARCCWARTCLSRSGTWSRKSWFMALNVKKKRGRTFWAAPPRASFASARTAGAARAEGRQGDPAPLRGQRRGRRRRGGRRPARAIRRGEVSGGPVLPGAAKAHRGRQEMKRKDIAIIGYGETKVTLRGGRSAYELAAEVF